MFGKKRDSTSGSTSDSATATAAETFTLEDRLRRVTRKDLSVVTVEDIQRLKASVDNEELRLAMLVMMETNRFSEVLSCSTSPTWNAAARGVTLLQMGLIGSLVRQKASHLYSVLPFVSEDFLETMRAAFVTRPGDV